MKRTFRSRLRFKRTINIIETREDTLLYAKWCCDLEGAVDGDRRTRTGEQKCKRAAPSRFFRLTSVRYTGFVTGSRDNMDFLQTAPTLQKRTEISDATRHLLTVQAGYLANYRFSLRDGLWLGCQRKSLYFHLRYVDKTSFFFIRSIYFLDNQFSSFFLLFFSG